MSELDEARAIENVVARLEARFPTVSHEDVAAVVREEQHRLDDGRVRDFVPVLVEHAARDRLRAEAGIDAESAGPAADDGTMSPAARVGGQTELDPMEIERNSRRGGFLFGDIGGGPV
ncbi:three-helix bundle dimerization domain-containing protein [Agromyces humatus]|uniref:DUF3562 domain-containing protein n=1 Tax=Agromyces humatus TaxID=279573 RepID=A0ABN2KNK5_9MICO|nr:hypothetical protein [Agromyces humatus]